MTTKPGRETFMPRGSDHRVEFEIRPGVMFPNWSVVHSDIARSAIRAVSESFDVEKRWAGCNEAEDGVRCTALEHFARHGRAPTIPELAEITGMAASETRELIGNLVLRDLVVLDESGTKITGAYPFTERDTGHRVGLDGRTLYAMCAIDALGAGAMIGEDAAIESACRFCGALVAVETGENGAAVKKIEPEAAVVWSGIEYAGGCAATSLCTAMVFFCSDEHLESWQKSADRSVHGFRLTIDEAHQVGTAIFTPMLASAASSS